MKDFDILQYVNADRSVMSLYDDDELPVIFLKTDDYYEHRQELEEQLNYEMLDYDKWKVVLLSGEIW